VELYYFWAFKWNSFDFRSFRKVGLYVYCGRAGRTTGKIACFGRFLALITWRRPGPGSCDLGDLHKRAGLSCSLDRHTPTIDHINQLSFPTHCTLFTSIFACVFLLFLLLSHVLRSGVFYVGFRLVAVPLPQYIPLMLVKGSSEGFCLFHFCQVSRGPWFSSFFHVITKTWLGVLTTCDLAINPASRLSN
jgi:hypothetical protein